MARAITSRPAALLFLFAVILASTTVVVTQPACNDIPNATCFGDKVDALHDLDGGADPRAEGCIKCMQQAKCCDVLGACSDDGQCSAEFKATHRCLIENGASQQAECKQNLDGGASKALFNCVRPLCGDSCGIPSCDLDPAVTLFVSPTCDHCITGACCSQINACYKNRQCQLFLECITNRCPKTTGASLSNIAQFPAEALDAFEKAVCSTTPTPDAQAQAGAFDPGPCLDRCLAEYATPEAGLPEENRIAQCLAVGVYTCGAKSGCGPRCTVDRITPAGAYPEDDAGAEPVADAGGD